MRISDYQKTKLVIGRDYDLDAFRDALGVDGLLTTALLQDRFSMLYQQASTRYDFPQASDVPSNERKLVGEWRELKPRIILPADGKNYLIKVRSGNEARHIRALRVSLDELISIEDFTSEIEFIARCANERTGEFNKEGGVEGYLLVKRYRSFLKGNPELLTQDDVNLIGKLTQNREVTEREWAIQDIARSSKFLGKTGFHWKLSFEDLRYYPILQLADARWISILDSSALFCRKQLNPANYPSGIGANELRDRIYIIHRCREILDLEESMGRKIGLERDGLLRVLYLMYPPPAVDPDSLPPRKN